MDDTDRRIINHLQAGFPLAHSPYRQAATALGLDEGELLARLRALLDDGTLTRFGPLYNAERLGGALTLAAVSVPAERFDEVAAIINAFPEVAHNYARDHRLNMWFVLATETPARQRQVLAAIAERTGLKVLNLPKIREYAVHLRLDA